MSTTSPASVRYGRTRLVVSWLVWLAAGLLAFAFDKSYLAFGLAVLACYLRPPPPPGVSLPMHLGAAIATLFTIPAVAILLSSESAAAFMRTPPGMIVIVAIWGVSVVTDLGLYRSLRFDSAKQVQATR